MSAAPPTAANRPPSDVVFYFVLALLGGVYVVLILAMLAADIYHAATAPDARRNDFWAALASEEMRYAVWLSLISCTITTVLSLWVAVPLGYLLSRTNFPGKSVADTILDIPIVLPPIVIGISLLILFQTPLGLMIQSVIPVTFQIPSVIIAQFTVAAAFAVRTMRVTFDQINPRVEQVALTLGCSRGQAFWWVSYPQAKRGMLAAATLAWARSLGEFGPIVIFAGSTSGKTLVLPTQVFLENSTGKVEAALAVSLFMVLMACVVLIIMRAVGVRHTVMA
jgi:molybdate transport system permease protein